MLPPPPLLLHLLVFLWPTPKDRVQELGMKILPQRRAHLHSADMVSGVGRRGTPFAASRKPSPVISPRCEIESPWGTQTNRDRQVNRRARDAI
jgi:hypothetical protein